MSTDDPRAEQMEWMQEQVQELSDDELLEVGEMLLIPGGVPTTDQVMEAIERLDDDEFAEFAEEFGDAVEYDWGVEEEDDDVEEDDEEDSDEEDDDDGGAGWVE